MASDDPFAAPSTAGSSNTLTLSDSSGQKVVQGYLGVATVLPSGEPDRPPASSNEASAPAVEDEGDEPFVDLEKVRGFVIHLEALLNVERQRRAVSTPPPVRFNIASSGSTASTAS